MGNQDDGTEKPRRRLRIPAALAVAFVGTSASAAMMFAGCSTQTPDPVDAGQASSVQHDAAVGSGSNVDTDAMMDAGQAIADAPAPPPDAPKPPVDAYMPPPDAPHT
jgi:hypothetical protein